MTEFERLQSGQWANTMDLSILKPMARAYMLTPRFNKTWSTSKTSGIGTFGRRSYRFISLLLNENNSP